MITLKEFGPSFGLNMGLESSSVINKIEEMIGCQQSTILFFFAEVEYKWEVDIFW